MKLFLPTIALLLLAVARPHAHATEVWLTCIMVDGQQAQISIPKDNLRVRTETGEWNVHFGTFREVKFVQQDDATQARIIYPSGYVTTGQMLNRTIEVKTADNERMKLNPRLMQSVASPILGGHTDKAEPLQSNLPINMIWKNGESERLQLGYSVHRFSGSDFSTDLSVAQVRRITADKGSRLIVETAYGDRLAGRFDPPRIFGYRGGQPTTLPLRDIAKATIDADDLGVGGGYLWWVMKNGNRICARTTEIETSVRLEDGNRANVQDIRSARPLGKGLWEFVTNGTTLTAKPLTKKINVTWLLDGKNQSIDWNDLASIVLPGQEESSPAKAVAELPPPIEPAPSVEAPPAVADTLPPLPGGGAEPGFQAVAPAPAPLSSEWRPAIPVPSPSPSAAPDPAATPSPAAAQTPDTEVPPAPTPDQAPPRKPITPPPDLAPDAWLEKCLSLEFREAFVSGGTYKLGDAANRGLSDEQPAIGVDVRSYFMDMTEVSKGAFQIFAKNNRRYKTAAERSQSLQTWKEPGFTQQDDEPVVWVSWRDAAEYCNWRSQRMKLEECYKVRDGNVVCDRTKNGYRLPTEAEWEYAVREGGRPGVFPFGGTDNPSVQQTVALANFKQKQPGPVFDGYRFTSPAGSYPANRLGIYDLTGNVWEWCEDYYHPEAYYLILSREKNDPCVERSDAPRLINKCMRGGSWENESLDFLRSSSRGKGPPTGSRGSVGFRAVRTAP